MFFTIVIFYILYIILCLLLYIYSIKYFNFSTTLNITVCIISLAILLYSIHTYFYSISYYVTRNNETIPNISSVNEAYHMLHHGDVIFLNDNPVIKENFYMYFNKGLYHTGIVVEEQGKKYIIHSATVNKIIHTRIKILQTYNNNVCGIFSNWKWHIKKESLLEHLLIRKSMFNVYRSPVPVKQIKWTKQKNPSFCCNVIATLLQENGIIPKSDAWLIPYFTTDEFISVLKDHGYKSFYFKQI